MLSCREVTKLVSEGLDRELPIRKRVGLRLHALMCGACRAYARQVRLLDQLVRARFSRDPPEEDPAARGPGLGAEARARIQAALRR